MGFSSTKLQARGVIVDDSNPLPVSIVASPSSTGTVASASLSFTRPENTTAYDAGDVIGIADSGTPANAGSAIHTLASVGPAGSVQKLVELSLYIGLTAVPSGMGNFRVHFYNASPTAILDNAAYDLVANDRAKYLGYVDLVTPADFGSTLWAQDPIPRDKEFKLASAATDFYVQIETRAGFTPASATAYSIQAKFATV